VRTLKEDILERRARLSPAARALLEKRLRGESGPDSRDSIPRREGREHPPLSFAQQRLWFLNRLEPWSVAYNEFEIDSIAGAVDVVLLERSLNEVVRRHEILRTVFLEEEGQPFQVILPDMTLALPVVDIEGLPELVRQAEMRRLAAKVARQPFDLARGPLLRMVLLRLGKEELALLWAMHHIICDGWSMGIFIREMMALYVAFSQGLPSSLPELLIQYADFAAWQRNWLQGEVLERQLAYWQERLDGTSGVLELPVDHPRPPVPTYQGATRPFALSEALTGALRDLCQRERVTLFMVLLAAFDVLLWRYTGQEDILVGSPVAGRNWVETEELIGLFINTLVLRVDLSGNPSFRELLGQAREVTLEAYAHQDLPFEVLVGALRLERDTSRAPLAQVLFSHQVIPDLAQDPSRSGASEFRGGARVDLELQVMEHSADVSGYLLYNTDIFDDETIARLLDHFKVLLESIVANPDRRIVDLPLLAESERQQLLVAWNDTEMGYSRERCVHEMFEEQAARTPDKVAVVFAEQNLTYRNLSQRANQLGHYLQRVGVGPGVSVGICVERSLDMVVGVLGILKAGGNYVPLDPAHPDDRLAYILEDSQAPILLTQQQVFDEKDFSGYGGQVILLDEMWRTISREPEAVPASQVSSQNLAYTIYTSGSTGRPKGVQILHRAVVNFLTSMSWRPGFASEDVLLAVTTLCFDIAGLEIFLPLVTGGREVLLGREDALEGRKLAARLTDCGATKMQATPATWQLLLESGWQGSEKLTALCGGEAFPRQLANRLIDKVAEVWNMYGPTETTIWSSIYPVGAGNGAIPIGRPVANTQFYVLNEHLEPAPIGVWGELYIGGDGLARGYPNRPRLTAEKFVPNPFGDKEGARLYRTGDVVRYLSNGGVEFLGRVDHQVKVHGHRIELAEIEVTLGQHPAVQQVVVVVQGSEAAKRLVAYVVATEGQKPTVSDMSRFLGDRLPRYMVPVTFVELDAFPLTPNGKVDRRALPIPDRLRPKLDVAYVAPQSTVERTIAEIWQEALQVEQVGIHDNFFDVGGHSLLLPQMHNKLQAALDGDLSLMDLFNYPTIAALGEYLSQGSHGQPFDQDDDRGEKLQDGQARLRQLFGRSAGARTV
jgi:amino acid adenylation domain-containing protein